MSMREEFEAWCRKSGTYVGSETAWLTYAAGRNAGLEEAAKVCEGQAGTVSMFATSADARAANHAVKGCAAAIRALKNTSVQSGATPPQG